MARFIGVHKFSPETTEDQMKSAWEGYKQACQGIGLKPLSLLYSLPKGVAYCQTEADSADQVREAHQGVAVALEDVFEVEILE